MGIQNLISLLGIVTFMGIAWVLSNNRRVMNWRLIAWGVALQLVFALFVFQVPQGRGLFLIINDIVVKILDSATAGIRFVFGRLALPPGTTNAEGETSLGYIFAFQAVPAVIFFASLVGLLYYLSIMQQVIKAFALVFTKLMRISGAEALCVSSNIFVGIESSLTIRPFLDEMTHSELCTILTAGMATIASSVLALYVFLLQREFPEIAGHLVSASILSAPAAIVMSKIIYPETGQPVTLGIKVEPHYERESNFVESIIAGANNGVRLAVGMAALLLAFLGLVALVDLVLGTVAGWFGSELSLKIILGYIFYPLTWLLGVPHADVVAVARLIGERTVATEVQSYQDLAKAIASGSISDPRTIVITTYALCGFAHIASLAIFVGGTAAIAPKRTTDLSRLGFRALLAATLACLTTGAVAGLLYSGGSILSGH